MIPLRSFLIPAVLALLAPDTSASGAMRVMQIPSRAEMMIITRYEVRTPVTPLPQPVATGLGKGAQLDKPLPANFAPEMDIAPATISVVDPNAELKAKKQAERDRLNHNALMWQLDRAKAGSGTAMRSIGMRYLTGDGLEKNEKLAREWLKKGADKGDTAAEKELAKLDAPKKDLEKK